MWVQREKGAGMLGGGRVQCTEGGREQQVTEKNRNEAGTAILLRMEFGKGWGGGWGNALLKKLYYVITKKI